jgi:hypothetical protein
MNGDDLTEKARTVRKTADAEDLGEGLAEVGERGTRPQVRAAAYSRARRQ